jgi:hypothetical protein
MHVDATSHYALGHVELGIHLLVLRPLSHQERIPRRSLSDGRVQAENELHVQVVHLGKEEDAVNMGEGNAVICRFAEETEGVVEEFERVSSSARQRRLSGHPIVTF